LLSAPDDSLRVNEAKMLFTYIIMTTYDSKFEEKKGLPREIYIAGFRFPVNANVVFRTRQK
jgi:hypothetical protein